MERKQIEEKVIEFAKEVNGCEVTMETSVDDVLDSLDVIELQMKCESEYAIQINDTEWENAETFKDCCNIIEKLI